MDKRLIFLFRLIYLSIALFAWYVAYEIFKIRGIYQGEIPENIPPELLKYIYHPLMGLLNLSTVWAYCGGTTIGATLGSMENVVTKPLWVNLLAMSIMLNVTWGLLYILEWGGVIE